MSGTPEPAAGAQPATDEDPVTAQWRALLTGVDPSLRKIRRRWQHVPAAPRCKVCASPFTGLGGTLAKVLWHGPLPDNPLLCKACFGQLTRHPGGAEVEISIVFADVRGSTGLAEHQSARDYHRLLQRYYRAAAGAIDTHGGIIDKFLGDGIMALFIPVITGENHAGRAIDAGRAILMAVDREGLARQGLQVGAGVHAGEAFVGVVGSDQKIDFTALGDTVNVAARLGGLAGPGELLVSRHAWDRAGLPAPADERDLPIPGRSEALPVVMTRPAPVAAA
jgi:adenylate cyclase